MLSAAQIEANRQNAQASTGPRTDAGKARSSQNATKLGLFSTANHVLPEEQSEYDDLSAGLWDRLRPHDPLEEAFAIEIVRAIWRLRRCALAEAGLSLASDAESAPAQNEATQLSVDRARTKAFGILTRATAELRRLQSERWVRREALPEGFDASPYGLAETRQVGGGVASNTRAQLLIAKANRMTLDNKILTQARKDLSLRPWDLLFVGSPRNAPCPCGSGVKHKRCCGENAPPVLHPNAPAAAQTAAAAAPAV